MNVILFLALSGDGEKPRLFFERTRVDYWGDRSELKLDSWDPASLWGEPGRTIHTPPKHVVDFLENPTRENARRYIAWQEERMRKLKAAMDVLDELRKVRTPTEVELQGRILYFKQPDCPYCVEQDKVLAALGRRSPRLEIRIASPDSPLWRELDVRVVPTLLVTDAKGKRTLIQGPASEDQLQGVLTEVHRD